VQPRPPHFGHLRRSLTHARSARHRLAVTAVLSRSTQLSHLPTTVVSWPPRPHAQGSRRVSRADRLRHDVRQSQDRGLAIGGRAEQRSARLLGPAYDKRSTLTARQNPIPPAPSIGGPFHAMHRRVIRAQTARTVSRRYYGGPPSPPSEAVRMRFDFLRTPCFVLLARDLAFLALGFFLALTRFIETPQFELDALID